jgi:Anti-anti-sigma regulatory factor (antagonist of anti-sigma factor)
LQHDRCLWNISLCKHQEEGVIIKFRARVSGIFEIIQPALEKGEVFDSNLLKDTLNSYIAEGKRNFAIDLSPLDYIYSDAINVILALNRRILDVSGRLSLLSPNPEVRSILERTGLHNILKIYETETDLLRSSEDIILQTTRFNLSDLKSYQQPSPTPPKSEFDEFKSEISTAMAPGQPADNAGPYGALDTEIPDDSFVKQTPHYEEPFAPPPRQPVQQFQAQEQDFGPVSPPRRKQPRQAPQPASEMAPETPQQHRHEREAAPELPEVKTGRKTVDRDFDRFAREDRDGEYEDEKPKRSLMPVLIGIVILVLVGAGIVGYLSFIKKPEKQVTLQTPATPAPAPQTMPELSQPAQPPATAVAPAPETAVQPPAAKAAAPVERPVEKPASVKQASSRSASSKTSEFARKSTSKSAASGRLTIVSKPSGASIIADGKILGSTPYKWVDAPQGAIVITLSKQGYVDAIKTIDYAGGNKIESTVLVKETAVPRSEPVVQQPPAEPAPAPVPAAPPAAEPAPEVSAPPPPAPSAAPTSSGESATIFISSMPPVADVYMDGKLIGKTNISKLNVSPGTHSMKFVKGTIEVTEDMTFKPGDNPSHFLILKK